MKSILVSTILAVLVCSTAVNAGPDSGSTEVSASFMFLKPENGDYTQVVMGGMGFFVPSWLEIKGTVIWFGSEGSTAGAAGGGIDIHVAPGQLVVPYVGAGILACIGDRELADDTMLDMHVGVKHFVSDGVSVNYSLSQWTSSGESDTTYFLGLVGVSFYL